MKIFLNKFVLLIIFVIFMLIGYQIYKIDNSFSYKDTNSYFYLIKGNGYISSNTGKKILKVGGEKENIKAGDFVATIGTDSLGIIEWGDNSITRIGGNSRLEIKESDIKNDLSEIKINFRLENGKSWSNVVNMFGEKSYFKEEFQNVIAGVRGTVFEVNLDNKYVYVKSHQVELENTKTEEKTIISEGGVFSYDFWKALDGKMKDFIWGQLNENIDKEYLIKLKNQTEAYLNEYKGKFNINNYLNSKYKVIDEINSENPSLDKIKEMISSMTESDKNTLYYMLMFNYQKLNIVDSSSDLFTKKMLYRDVLMLVATDENKKNILKYTLYDLNDSLSSSQANLGNIV
ncbi:MAG: FecR domain-containing protein, partial [Candidatus Gracilibacteria bacterium]|nr:FecR domain-containing protein [Candidatus Gracilibacteria bacterium]